MLPVHQGRLVVVLDTLAGGSNAPVTFAAGEAAVAPIEALKGLLRELPKVVPLGGALPSDPAPAVDFADGGAIAAAIETEMRTAREAGQTISAADALARVKKGARA